MTAEILETIGDYSGSRTRIAANLAVHGLRARLGRPNSRTVVFPTAGHGQLGFSCTQTLIAEFVVRGTAAGLDTSCAQTAAIQPFDTRP